MDKRPRNKMETPLAGWMAGEGLEPGMVRDLTRHYIRHNLSNHVVPLPELIADIERMVMKTALLITRDNKKRAAELLGLKYTTFFEKMKKSGLHANRIELNQVMEIVLARLGEDIN